MILWLELRGWPVLHGAAVEVHGGAVLLLAPGGTGKSTLAAMFANRGFRILGDDAVTLARHGTETFAIPSYPRIALWPGHFLGPDFDDFDNAPRVFPRTEKRSMLLAPRFFCQESRPITAVYSLNRDALPHAPSQPTLRRLSPAQAVLECVRHSVSRASVHAVGLQPARLQVFAHLVSSAPVMRLRYASGLDRLESVYGLIARSQEDAISEPCFA